MSKKIIGIPGWDVKAGEHFGVTVPYLIYLSNFANIVILTPGARPEVDLLVLPGGADVDTLRYGQMTGWWTSKPNMFLESFDNFVLPEYVKRGTPIFGICRGLQTLAVHFGGSLHQNIDVSPKAHGMSKDAEDVEVHGLWFPAEEGEEKPSKAMLGNRQFKVGSWHHQAINEMSDCMKIDLISDDGGIEAISHKTLPIKAVQWHPERCYDGWSGSIIEEFLK